MKKKRSKKDMSKDNSLFLVAITLCLVAFLGSTQKIDEYQIGGINYKCNNLIQGCNRCYVDVKGSQNFVVCNECSEGLYLLKNYTYTANYPSPYTNTYPSVYSSCVPDCKKAHGSFVNDFVSGTCQWCGEYCASCNLKNGCELCQGDITDTPWTTSTTYSTELTTIQTPSYGTGAVASRTFKECRRCDNYKTCMKCSSTNPSYCTKCFNFFDDTTTPGTCLFDGRATKHYYNDDNAASSTASYLSYDNNCQTWGGSVNCQYCKDKNYRSTNVVNHWYDEPFCSNYCETCGCGCSCSNSVNYYFTCLSNSDAQCLRAKTSNGNYCQLCDMYYGLNAVSGSVQTCDACLSSIGLKQYYFDQIACNTYQTCKDGYIHLGRCVTRCPPGYYGRAYFSDSVWLQSQKETNAREIQQSKCEACGDTNCYECMGAAANQCTSCKKNYYLSKTSYLNSFGTCEAKEPRGTFIYTLYVNPENLWTANPMDVQSRTGESGSNNEFNQLQDAIKKAYEMAAPFNKAEITIILKSGGTHAMVRRAEDTESFYLPNRWDDWSQHLKLIIKGDGVVTVRYKLRDTFKFLVGNGITIENVIFQAVDSINTPYTTAQKTCLSQSDRDCCLLNQFDPTSDISLASPSFPVGTPVSTDKCFFPREPNEQCYYPQGTSFFKFDLNANSNSGSRTQMQDAPTLTLTNVQFLNFLYEFNSFIELNDQGGHIVMTGVIFKNFNTCGAIIRNKRKNLKQTSTGFTESATETYWSPSNSYANSYIDRSRNQAYEMLEAEYYETVPSASFLTCQLSGVDCFSIKISTTKFYNFGQLKTAIASPILVDDQMLLQYSGSVLDLDNFKGAVVLSKCEFYSNIVSYSNCDSVQSLDSDLSSVSFSSGSAYTFTDSYPNYKTSTYKNRMQIRSVISIVRHKYMIEISDSIFIKNSGTKGIIYIDKSTTSTSSPIIIFNNQFTQNMGYMDSSVVYIRQRGTNSGGHIDNLTPDNANIYCTGQHFQSNTYTNNFACPKWGGATVRIDCQDINDQAPTYQRNDRIDQSTLSTTQQGNWYTQGTSGTYDSTQQATYTPIATSTAPTAFTYDLKVTQFVKEVYTGNYASGGKGIIDIYGVPRVSFNDIQFLGNGDSIKEVLTTYGLTLAPTPSYPTPLKGTSGAEMTIGNAIGSTVNYPTSKLCQAMIQIQKSLIIKITKSTFNQNWLLENAYDGNRAQLVTLRQFYGEFYLDEIMVYNQKGMGGINSALGSLTSLGVPSGMSQTASYQPLFKWQSTDKVYFKPYIQTGNSKFSNIQYTQTQSGGSIYDRLFWPAIGTLYTLGSQLILKNVDMDNIQCYACYSSPISTYYLTISYDTLTMKNINSVSFSSTDSACTSYYKCKQIASFFYHYLSSPTSSTTGNQVVVNKMQVDTIYGGCEGRLFYFDSSTGSDSNGLLRESVIFTLSSFQRMYHECDGGFARVNLRKMQMRIDGVHPTDLITFKTVHARYSPVQTSNPLGIYGPTGFVGFGGVLYIENLYSLSLVNIVAEDFRVRQNTLTNGGGRFLYFKETFQTSTTALIKIVISVTGSNFRCESASTAFPAAATIQTNLGSSYVDQGSAFHAQSTYNNIEFTMSNSKVEYCLSAIQGSAVYLSSPLKKTLTITNTRFANNIALSGGSIYCDTCYWQTLQDNEFQSNYAMVGGDMYMKQPYQYPVTFISHEHLGSTAYQEGAAIYLEDSSSTALPQVIIQKTGASVSQFTNNRCDVSGCSGGAISLKTTNQVVVSISDTNFISNYAGYLGAAIYIANSLKSTATVTLTSCSFNTNTAKTSASVLYVPNSATTATITVVDTNFFTNKATDSDGGLFHVSATTSNTIKFQNVGAGPFTIQDSQAGNNGGVFYMNSNKNILTIDQKTKILLSKANQNGGVAYIQGNDAVQTNEFNLNGGYIENSIAQSGSGGVAYMTGLAKFLFKSYITLGVQPNIKTVTSGSHGGVLYMNGLRHTIDVNQLQVISAYSAGEGGFLYSTTNTQNLQADIVQSQFLGVYAATQGSIISMRKGSSDPILILNINTNSVIQCLNTYTATDVLNIGTTLQSTATPPSPSTIGGAFFFDSLGVTSTVTSSQSTYQNCYTAISGAVFYLPPNTVFTDYKSVFQQNAAFKGAIYCQSCDAKFTGSIFKNNIAYDGSIIYLLNDAKAWFKDQAVLQNGLAYRYGGAIFAGGTGVYPSSGTQVRPYIIIETCTLAGVTPSNPIINFEAKQSGGFIYTDHPKMIIDISACAFNNIVATQTGGFIHGAQFDKFTLTNCLDGLKNVKAGTSGSLIYSINPNIKFALSSCSITCENPFTVPTSTTVNTVNRGSLIDLKYADTVSSNNNRFEYCYTASQGSVFKLSQIKTSMTDSDSYFTNNAGQMGGAIYIEESTATFTRSVFSNNWGQKGGTFYLTKQQYLTLTDVTVQSSSSTQQGGFLYAEEPLGTQTVTIDIKRTAAQTNAIDFSNIKADLEGGIFYMNDNRVALKIEGLSTSIPGMLRFDNIQSATEGGIVYSKSQLGISIKKVQINSVTTNTNGGIMYINKASDILIEDTNIYSAHVTTGKGGVLYLASTVGNPLSQVTMTRVTTSDVYSRLSGSIIYSEATTPQITLTSNQLDCKSTIYGSAAMGPAVIGGAFFIKGALGVTSSSNTIKYCYNSDVGGAFHIENSKLTDTQSVLRDNMAVYGGAISCKSCSLLSLTLTEFYHNAAFTTAPFTGGLGGVIYLEEPTIVTMNKIKVIDGYALNKGGFVYAVGTSSSPVATFTIDNTPFSAALTLEQFKSDTSGGGFYVDHPKLSISMIAPVAVKNSKALSGSGGFFYFNQVSAVSLGSSTFEDVSSSVSGSFLYSVATGLQLTVASSSVNCASTPQQSSSNPLDLSTTLGIAVPTQTRGGAFYIQDATTPTQLNTLTLFNCYTGDKGGAYTLINTILKDQSSRYDHNGAVQGGSVYCNNCWMELNDVQYLWSQALDGGTFYIKTLMSTASTTPMQVNVKITNSKAFRDGGAFYVGNTGTSTRLLDISDMTIGSTSSIRDGGMMYIDNTLQSVTASNVQVTNSFSTTSSGGVFFVKNSAAITISESVSPKSYYQNVNAPEKGSFMYSESTTMILAISNTDVECQTTALPASPGFLASWDGVSTPYQDRAGAFYIQNAATQITSTQNIFQRCYAAKQGGIFSLVSSKLLETGSTYNQNAAIKGGVFYLDDSKLDITQATITNSMAGNGGIIYKLGKQNLDIKSTIITTAYAKQSGSIGHFIEKAGFSSPADLYTVSFTSPIVAQKTTLTGLKSVQDGGAFYVNSKQISAMTFDTVILQTSLSSDLNGGVFYINSIGGILTLTSSVFSDFSSTKQGSFLYSALDSTFGVVSTGSSFDCKSTSYDATPEVSKVLSSTFGTVGGAFYIKGSTTGVVSSLSFYRNCFDSYEGGAFYLINTQLVDTKSKFMQNNANYGGAIKCDNCILTLTDSEVSNNDAFDGGAIYSVNKITLTATRTTFYNNKAKNNGGVLAVTNTAYTVLTPTVLIFQSCPNIQRNKADWGAFAYYDNDYAELKIIDSTVMNHTAFKRSAFVEAMNMQKFSITRSYLGDVFAPLTTAMHSVARKLDLKITDSDVVCDSSYKDWDAYKFINTTTVPQYTHHTKFYLEAAKNVSLTNNKMRMCGTSLYGGVFWLTQGTNFYDYASTFEYNSAANGGVINCQTCQMDLQLTFFQYNQAWRGGAIELKENAFMKTRRVKFDRNLAFYTAGAIYVNTFSYMEIHENQFTSNQAPENSAIEVLQSAKNKNITIVDCLFEKNIAIKNTICLRDANVAINKTTIQRNQARYLSKHLFIGFSNVYIEDTQFKGVPQTNARLASLTDETLGSHIYAILSSKVFIKDTYFLDGLSKLGGAIFIEGNSSIDMTRVLFQNNFARRKGGAIYANGFDLLRSSGDSKFLNNLAIEDGDDFYISNTEGYFLLENTLIDNPKAASSIAAENVNVTLSKVTMRNIGVQPIRALTEGAGLSCYNCRAISIKNSQFTNLNSLRGGAIYIEESEDNKLVTDNYGKYQISSTSFDSCSAVAGGAIYLNNPQYLTIDQNSVFSYNKAKNSSSDAFKSIRGSGGSIFYECNENSMNCLVDITNVAFANNYAEIKGGAIHWNTLEPLWGGVTSNGNLSTIKFSKNKAGRYGDNISAFAQQIVIIDEKDFKSSMFSATSFLQSGDSFGQSKNGNRLLSDETLSASEIIKNVSFTTETALLDQRSGGQIPKMCLGLVDKYGQIVASDDESKIDVMIDAFARQTDNTKFPPFIEGSTQYSVQNGVVQVKDVAFAASPGYNYSLRFNSPDIKPDFVKASKETLKIQAKNVTSMNLLMPTQRNMSQFVNLSNPDLAVTINITLRECQAGEQFQWNGKCSQCPTNTSFSLTKMDEPGECQTCPSDKAVCYGGTNVGPAPGFWRSSNKSSNFLACLHKPACLGMIPPLNNPKGSCAEGYQGIMCADCQSGFTRSREYQCSKCPHKAWVFVRIFLIPAVVVAIVLILVSSQSKTRYLHVFLRSLINHIQLILLIAVFNFNWPDILQSFFDISRPVSQPFSEFLELDCLTHNYERGSQHNTVSVRFFFGQVLFLALLPVIFAFLSWLGWKIQALRLKYQLRKVSTQSTTVGGQRENTNGSTVIDDEKVSEDIKIREQANQNVSGKMVQTFTMLMFIAYPNIMQFMLNIFKCIDVDGEQRLKADLEILCWSTHHHLITFFVALPSLIVWGVGLPILAFVQLTNLRAGIISAKNPNFQETYGFIYGGFKADFYFWEIVITMRKLILIAVCIFVTNFGVLTQALITLLVLVLFLVLTARKRPFISEPLFDLEALSLATAIITVYCGMFYLSDTSQMGVSNFDRSSDVTIAMGKDSRTFLLSTIVGVNSIFFMYWLYRVFSEMDALRGFILKTFPNAYLLIFACGDKEQAYLDKQKNRVLNDNEGHKEELMRILRNVKELYNRGDLLLNDEVMQKLRHYMKPEKVLQVAGFVDQNDSDLNKKIQQQLMQRQELSGVDDNLLYQDRSVTMGSLLGDGPIESAQDQLRYLRALQAQNLSITKNLIDDDDAYVTQMLNDNQGEYDNIGEMINNEQRNNTRGRGEGDQIHHIKSGSNEKVHHQNLHIKRNSKTAEASPFSIYVDPGVKSQPKPPGSADTMLQKTNVHGSRLVKKQGPSQSDINLIDDEIESQKNQNDLGQSALEGSSLSNTPLEQPKFNGFMVSSSKEGYSLENNQGVGQSDSSKQVGTLI